jgi:voltage-gated potassium channel Kch
MNMKNMKTRELRASSYELFIGALSILSIFNLVLLLLPITDQVKQLILIVDVALTFIFLIDFTLRFVSAPVKSRYFFRGGGWLDLIGSLPTLRIFRLFRVLRVGRLLRRYGLRNVVRELLANPAQGGLLLAVFFAIVTLEFGSMFVLGVEQKAPGANILTGVEALWWGIVTMTTVGYGDYYPVTNPGRVAGAITMLIGIGLLGTFTGYLANAFLSPRSASSASDGDDPRAQLEIVRRQLDENARRAADLQVQLSKILAML